MAFNNIIDLRRLGIFLNKLAEVFAPISHTHGAGEITSGTLASDRLPTVPVSKGGTNATSVTDARNNLYSGALILYGTTKQSVTCSIMTNSGVLFIQRGTTKAAVMLDSWTTQASIFGVLPPDVRLVRSSASGSSSSWTIQNCGASAVTINSIGIKFGAVADNESEITENVPRVQIDVPMTAVQCDEIASGASRNFDFAGNVALIYGKRGSNYYVALIDYWADSPTVIASGGNVPTVATSANSRRVTISNNHSYAVPFVVLSVNDNMT